MAIINTQNNAFLNKYIWIVFRFVVAANCLLRNNSWTSTSSITKTTPHALASTDVTSARRPSTRETCWRSTSSATTTRSPPMCVVVEREARAVGVWGQMHLPIARTHSWTTRPSSTTTSCSCHPAHWWRYINAPSMIAKRAPAQIWSPSSSMLCTFTRTRISCPSWMMWRPSTSAR